MRRTATTARAIWQLIEPIHAVTYFAPEALGAFREAGYRGFWMGYFAGRAAPLGPATPELVHALFYNFTFARVARALPDAWSYAPPRVALEARERGATAALRRHLGALADDGAIGAAADLLARAVDAAPLEARPLFAANRALPAPREPVARLWHFTTLLREHRGDGHIAVLLASGIGGRPSHVLHSLAAGIPREVYVAARDFGADEWAEALSALQHGGYVDGGGNLTRAGRSLKQQIESRTDELASSAYAALTEAELDTLGELLLPIARAVVAAGDIPLDAPMGLNLREL